MKYGAKDDPLNLISTSGTFMSGIVFYGLIIAAVVLAFAAVLLLGTFPGWHKDVDAEGDEHEIKPFPSRLVTSVALACLILSFIFALISTLWQHIAAVAVATSLSTFIGGAITSHVGATSMALGWTAVGLLALAIMGVLVMILSIQLLDRLTDE